MQKGTALEAEAVCPGGCRSHIDLAQPLNVSASGQSSISFQVKITTLRISRCISGGGHGMGYVPSE